jgi:cytosine/creatinine deaminase
MVSEIEGLHLALEAARKSASEGGIPIGAALVSHHKSNSNPISDHKSSTSTSDTSNSEDKPYTVLGVGHNQRIQQSSATLHGEIDALESAGRLRNDEYRQCTMVSML